MNISDIFTDIDIFFKVASDLADFDTRWPHEYEILNFARFSSRIW